MKKASGTYIPRTGEGVRSLQILGSSSLVNQWSHLLMTFPNSNGIHIVRAKVRDRIGAIINLDIDDIVVIVVFNE